MASKIAAIFLRGNRSIGEAMYTEKGRDIYDLLWYMNKKAVPDFDYLIAKGISMSDSRVLFNKLTLQMNKVSDENLKQDLIPLFTNRMFIENWLKNWRESYLRLLDDYKIRTVTELDPPVNVYHDLMADNFYFTYSYKTAEDESVRVIVIYAMSNYWIDDVNLPTEESEAIKDKIEFTSNGATSHPSSEKKLRQYATLFHQKTEAYFKKTNGVMLGDTIKTKLIRLTANKFNPKTQIVLNKSALLSCELDDLLE